MFKDSFRAQLLVFLILYCLAQEILLKKNFPVKKKHGLILAAVKCLTIVCLNSENIPLVASMDFVMLVTQAGGLSDTYIAH
jgi:hypothetical protein